MKLIIYCIVFFFILVDVQATNIENFNSLNGLPSNFINSIVIDNQSKDKWVGTEKGLVIINNESKISKVEEVNNAINTITIINNTVWAGTYINGVIKINRNKSDLITKVIPYSSSDDNYLVNNIIRYNGEILVGTNGGGIYAVKGNKLVEKFKSNNSKLPSDNINAMKIIHNELWVGTESGLAIIKGKKIKVYKSFHQVNSFTLFNNNNVLLSSISLGGAKIFRISNYRKPSSFEEVRYDISRFNTSDFFYYKEIIYKNNALWVLSKNLAKLKNGDWKIFGDKIQSELLSSFAIEDDCTIWIGSEDKGLYRWNICHDRHKKQEPQPHLVSFDNVKQGSIVNLSIKFDYKSSYLEETGKLEELLEYLDSHPEIEIEVVGHTLPNPINATKKIVKDHQELSLERANAVKNFLKKNGIRSGRIRTLGMGGKKPLPDIDMDSELHQRVEIKILK